MEAAKPKPKPQPKKVEPKKPPTLEDQVTEMVN